jgi:hypothetical protein
VELLPDSVGSRPRSTTRARQTAVASAAGACEARDKVQGGRAEAQRLSWQTSEGRKVRRASAPFAW